MKWGTGSGYKVETGEREEAGGTRGHEADVPRQRERERRAVETSREGTCRGENEWRRRYTRNDVQPTEQNRSELKTWRATCGWRVPYMLSAAV